MKKSKFLSTLLCATMVASLLAGCGGSSSSSTQKETAGNADTNETTSASTGDNGGSDSTEVVEIHHAYWHGAMTDYLNECKAEFEKDNPNIKIVLDFYGWGEYWTALEAAATGGKGPDVFQLNGPNNYKYADYGIILPLDDYISNSDVDLSNYPDALNQIYNIDGVQYGIPVDWDTIGLWYNKELFDAAGVAYPDETWTWEDLVAAAEKITDPEKGIYGIDAGYADQGGFFNTVPAAGGYIINEDGTACGFDDEKTIKGLKVWMDLMEAGLSPSQANLTETAGTTQFMAGKLAMYMGGDWVVADFVQDEEFAKKIDVAILPTIDGNRASCIHGKANCISANSENPDEAWAWVSYLAGDEANEILGNSGAAIPAHLSHSELFFDVYPDYNMDVFSQMAEECAVPYPTSRGFQEWADVVWNELVPAYSLEVSIEEACKNIAEQMNKILAEYN